jgi:hypothetical protein
LVGALAAGSGHDAALEMELKDLFEDHVLRRLEDVAMARRWVKVHDR